MTLNGKLRLKTFADSLWTLAGGVPVVDQTGLTELGLTWQRATVPVDYLIVDGIEKPSEN